MKQELKILAVCLVIYAVYLPVAYWINSDYVPVPRPPGRMIETVLKTAHSGGVAYHTHLLVLWKYADESGNSPLMLYEDMTPLGPESSVHDIQNIGQGRFGFTKFTGDPRTFVIFSASDNSDPNTNGKHYWLVLP
jgi:hypothetical protein